MLDNFKKHLFIAVQFLTILPVRIRDEIEDRDFGGSLLYFPFAGLVIGVILCGIVFISSSFPAFLTAGLVLAASVVVSGGLHLDGFADTCDGFYAASSKERALEIMRDSSIGAMGVIGIVCLLLLKFALFSSFNAAVLWKTVIAMAVFSRWAVSLACYLSNYARKQGKAQFFIKYADKKLIAAGGVFALFLVLLLTGPKGGAVFILASILVFLFVKYSKRKIGGMTGDTLGAVNEIAETAFLFFSIVF